MKSPSWRDVELLSAYLDGQLSPRQQARVKARLEQDAALRQTLAGLQQTRALLRRVPPRRVPRPFTLTANMAGLRPPLPRLVPVFRWAAVTALVLFLGSLVVPFSLPMSSAKAPPLEATMVAQEMRLAAAPTEEQSAVSTLPAVTPEQSLRALSPSPYPADETGGETPAAAFAAVPDQEPRASGGQSVSLTRFQQVLLALAVLTLGTSLLLVWWRARTFRRRFATGKHPPAEGKS